MTTHAFSNNGLSLAELQKAVSQRYHCAIGDGTRNYGYVLEPDPQDKSGGFHWRTDTTTKQALMQYASQQLIDRDLAFFPRVTDGDFSGGGFQEVWLDPRRYFDADLDPRTPGFLTLHPSWTRVTTAAVTSASGKYQAVVWKNDYWYTFGEASGNIYSAHGLTTITPAAAAVVAIDTDGTYLYAATTTSLYRYDGTSWTTISTTLNAAAFQMWVIEQGTNGYFLYYTGGTDFKQLWKVDLTQAFPVAAGSQPQIPVGGNNFNIIDIVPYQTAIAILTIDGAKAGIFGTGSDVWYFDGVNLTRILRYDGYQAVGMCNCQGALYVGMTAWPKTNSPILVEITSGSVQIVARPGSPFPTANQTCLQPRSSSQYVYWPILSPSINGISIGAGVVIRYDVTTGAVSKLPTQDATDFATPGTLPGKALRSVAIYGDNVAICYLSSTNGILQYQTPAFGTITYMATGWLFSSHLDFGTPGIVKRFRRIEIHHAPLNAGEVVTIKGWVDNLDPLSLTTGSAPVPAGATATNSTAGSTVTAMTFGQDTVGKTLTFALELTAGTSQLTSPRINWVSVEVGGTWVAELSLACTNRRRLLTQEDDSQGATAADLAYLLMQAQENGTLLTFVHPNQQTYTMALESLDSWNPSPHTSQDNQRPQGEEYVVHAILRQVA